MHNNKFAFTLLTAVVLSGGLLVPVLAAEPSKDGWLDIPQQELVYLQLEPGTLAQATAGQHSVEKATVVLKLASEFTPKNTAAFKQLVQSGFYNGLEFYRVIDQFVLQAGLMEGEKHPTAVKTDWPKLQAEFSWPVRQNDAFTLVQQSDLLASQTGFRHGFALGRGDGQEWLIHCPNVVNMARSEDANSATTDFALMQGQAPRHLDRNMSIVAKVIWGGPWLNLVKRGEASAGGIIAKQQGRSRIVSMTLGSDLKPEAQLQLQWLDTGSTQFQQRLEQSRARTAGFFHYKGNGALDICYQQVPVRLKP